MAKERVAAQRAFTVTWVNLLAGAAAGVLTTLGSYAQREIRHRRFSLWEQCLCDFKFSPAIFQVWYSQHEQRAPDMYIVWRSEM